MILPFIHSLHTQHLYFAGGSSTSCIFSSMALLNMSDMSSFSNILKGSPIPSPRSPMPSATSTSLLTLELKLSTMTRSSSSLLDTVLDTVTVQEYIMGSAFGGGGGGLGFLIFFGLVGSVFSQRPNPI